MSNLSDKENNKERDWDRKSAQRQFENFVLSLLRNLSGGGSTFDTSEQFLRFIEDARESQVRIYPVIDGAVKNMRRSAFYTRAEEGPVYDRKVIKEAALRVIAESIASDGLAKARLSKRESDLRGAIESAIEANIERAERRAGKPSPLEEWRKRKIERDSKP